MGVSPELKVGVFVPVIGVVDVLLVLRYFRVLFSAAGTIIGTRKLCCGVFGVGGYTYTP